MLIGYATVSTTEQDTSLQLAALRRHGVRKVFEEQRLALASRCNCGPCSTIRARLT